MLANAAVAQPAWDYIGIPYPTENLPEEIMPTLPDGNNRQPGFPYDPCTIATPTWPGDGPNYYYIAHDGDDATAGNNGNGNPASPRATMPTNSPFPAGSLFFLEGDGTALPTDENTNRRVTPIEGWTFNGKNVEINTGGAYADGSDITWVIGINNPRLGANRNLTFANSNHIIFDGVILDGAQLSYPVRGGRVTFANSHYITFRNCAQYGEHADRGGSMFVLYDCSHIMYYKSEIAYGGLFDAVDAPDYHGFRASYRNRYLWIIESHLHHLAGDSMQIGNSNNTNLIEDTTHYVYFAGNNCHENRENSADNKNSFHVIISQNQLHDFTGNGAGGANGTALILAQDNEGPHSAYHWALGNLVYDSSIGIANKGNSSTPDMSYIIGNVVFDCDSYGIVVEHAAPDAAGTASYLINNTVARCDIGIYANFWQPANRTDIYINGNILYENIKDIVVGGRAIDIYQVKDNVIFKSAGGENIESGNADTIETITGNVLGADPLFVDPASNNFALKSGSPARNLTTEDAAYEKFQSLYGIGIKQDFVGTPRPSENSWDAGAYEFAGPVGSKYPSAPTDLRIIP